MTTLKEKKVVIIGASSGIGKAIASSVIEKGAKAIMVSRSLDRLQEASMQLPQNQFDLFSMDMLNEENVNETFDKINSFDHLVVTAVAEENKLRTPLQKADRAIAERSLQKFWGAFYVCRAAVGKVSATGSITLTSSVAIYKPSTSGDMSILTAGHGAVTAFATALAVELAPVRVNVVAPGVVDTSVWNKEQKLNLEKWAREKLPVKHLGNPNELAHAYITFMENAYITGTILKVDGGLTLI